MSKLRYRQIILIAVLSQAALIEKVPDSEPEEWVNAAPPGFYLLPLPFADDLRSIRHEIDGPKEPGEEMHAFDMFTDVTSC